VGATKSASQQQEAETPEAGQGPAGGGQICRQGQMLRNCAGPLIYLVRVEQRKLRISFLNRLSSRHGNRVTPSEYRRYWCIGYAVDDLEEVRISPYVPVNERKGPCRTIREGRKVVGVVGKLPGRLEDLPRNRHEERVFSAAGPLRS
jgi:hypothetical protein